MYLFQGTEKSSGQDAGYRVGVGGGGKELPQSGSLCREGGRRGQASTACLLCVDEMNFLALTSWQAHVTLQICTELLLPHARA